MVRSGSGSSGVVPPPFEALLTGSNMAVLAGAQLVVVDEELAISLGVEPGVRVVRAPTGTPAADAGLRVGDMILAANGVPLRELAPLRKVFSGAGAREVKLTVSARGGSPRIVTIRWSLP